MSGQTSGLVLVQRLGNRGHLRMAIAAVCNRYSALVSWQGRLAAGPWAGRLGRRLLGAKKDKNLAPNHTCLHVCACRETRPPRRSGPRRCHTRRRCPPGPWGPTGSPPPLAPLRPWPLRRAPCRGLGVPGAPWSLAAARGGPRALRGARRMAPAQGPSHRCTPMRCMRHWGVQFEE